MSKITFSLGWHLLPSQLQNWGSRPALTWYATDGERVELSGSVLAQHAIKIAGILHELNQTESNNPNTCVNFYLPPHWRSLTWALGAWIGGFTLNLLSPTTTDNPPAFAAIYSEIDCQKNPELITVNPSASIGSSIFSLNKVVVPLAPLALRVNLDLPWDVVDGAADVANQSDTLIFTPLVNLSQPVWEIQTSSSNSPLAKPEINKSISSNLLIREIQLSTAWSSKRKAVQILPYKSGTEQIQCIQGLIDSAAKAWQNQQTLIIFAENLAAQPQLVERYLAQECK